MLPQDFQFSKFGITARLVSEKDAKTIVNFRSDPKRTQYMITLDSNIEKQKEWIKEYKIREAKGEDYYFVFHDNHGNPIGLYRISHIDYTKKQAKGSSLITIRNENFYGLKISIIKNIIAFDILEIEKIYADVHKENRGAIKLMKLLNYTFIDSETDFFDLILDRNNYLKSLEKKIIVDALKITNTL